MTRGLLLLMCAVVTGAAPQLRGQEPDVDVGVRPARVRVGETVVITVRVVAAGWPEDVTLEAGDGLELLDVRDRASTVVGPAGSREQVFERDFVLRALEEGPTGASPVQVRVDGRLITRDAPTVEIGPRPLEWRPMGGGRSRPEEGETRVSPEGVPPPARGRTHDATRPPGRSPPPGYPYDPRRLRDPYRPPQPGAPYDPYPRGASPYDPTGLGWYGGLPPGEGWAATATSDPWWPELLPELDRYGSVVEAPGGLARLESGLTPERVFVGQQITLVATATFPPEARLHMTRPPEFFPPGAADAWVVSIPHLAPQTVAAGTRLQEAHTFMRAFFPVRPGSFTVDPARLLFSASGGGVARPPLDTLSTDALTVEVLAVPERDAPPGWRGAVGRYRVRSWVTPASVAWAQSAVLTVEVAGTGHLPSIVRPDPGPVWRGGVRPVSERAWVEVRDGVVGGVKRFTWLVVPTDTGPVRLGPVVFVYFDPYVGGFGQVASDELILEVGVPAEAGRDWRPPPRGESSRTDGHELPSPVRDSSAVGPAATPWEHARSISRARVPEPGGTDRPVQVVVGQARTGGFGDRRPEADAARLRAHLSAHPHDGSAWHDLGVAYARARPGEGWAEWAWRSGLRRAPRDRALRLALWGDALWRREPGLPYLPLTAAESAAMAGLLGLGALVAGGLSVRRARRLGARSTPDPPAIPPRPSLALSGTLLLFALGVGYPSFQLQADEMIVTVAGVTTLRQNPTATAEGGSTVASGTPLESVSRYGRWVRVTGPGGASGWVEANQVAVLEPVLPFRR